MTLRVRCMLQQHQQQGAPGSMDQLQIACLPQCDAHAQEGERVMATFKEHLHLPVTMIDDSQRMLSELQVPRREVRTSQNACHSGGLGGNRPVAMRPCRHDWLASSGSMRTRDLASVRVLASQTT